MAVETLRPNAAGDETNIVIQYPDAGAHWDKVDEAESDDDSTLVLQNIANISRRDLYNIEDHSVGSGTINSVKVYAICRGNIAISGQTVKIAIKSGATIDESVEKTPTLSYASYDNTWAINPATSSAFTWEEIDNLQVGIALRCGTSSSYNMRCTQVYVEVDYTLPQTYELSCSDGLKAGDTCVGTRVYQLSVTDGLSSGDSPVGKGVFNNLVIDGVELSDLGAVIGVFSMLLEDGVTLSDIAQWATNVYWLVATDGISLGDTSLGKIAILLQAIDGLEVGDTPSTIAVLQSILQDGVKLGDAIVGQLSLMPALTDGIKVGDTPVAIKILEALATDGMVLGDLTLAEVAGRLLKVLLFARAYRDLTVYARPYYDQKVYTAEVEE